MTAADLRAEFRRDPALPMHVGDDPFKKLVIKGITDGIYIYQRDTLTAGKGDPVPSIVIDDGSIISTAEFARDHGIFPRRAPAAEPAAAPTPGAGGENAPATTGGSGEWVGAPGGTRGTVRDAAQNWGGADQSGAAGAVTSAPAFTGEGVLRDALSTVFQKARGAKVERVLTLAITPFDPAHFYLLLNVVEIVPGSTRKAVADIQFETAAGSIVGVSINGTVGDAKQTRDYVEPQLRAATERHVTAKITLAFEDGLPLGGDEPEKIIERLTKFGTAAAFVEVTAEA